MLFKNKTMVSRINKKLIVAIILGTLMCIGLGKVAMSGSIVEKEESSKSSMHYELPKLIPTTWIGRK